MQRKAKPSKTPKGRGKTKRHTLRTCDGKIRFRDKREADSAVKRIGNTSSRSSVPKRSYPCYECNGWHLSSRPDRFGQV